MAYQHGMFTWADISAPDPTSEVSFYTSLFGWDAEDQHDPDGNYVYTMFSLYGKTVAGLGPQSPDAGEQGMPAMWNSYITVDNVNATADGWALAGGKIVMPPLDVFTSGRMAVVADPEGAFLALWQAQDHPGSEIFNVPGAMGWNELNTRDSAAARDFYGKVLGWEFEQFEGEGPTDYWLIRVPGKKQGSPLSEDPYNGGIFTMGDNFPPEIPAHWSVYFNTTDVDGDVAKITEMGGSIVAGPMDSAAGRFAVVADPAGAIFNIIAPQQSS
jgi:predicted enzyme related to lactoylglutathione lyase